MLYICTGLFFICATYLFLRYRKLYNQNRFYNKKHVFITGGSSGIGLALAKLARKYGANITLVARNKQRLESAKNELDGITSDNTSAWVNILSLDLSSSYEIMKSVIENNVDKSRPIDVLIHCAGYAVSREFCETPVPDIAGMMQTNYLAPVYLTHILLPSMRLAAHGFFNSVRERRIAFVSSMAGQVGVAGLAAYSGSKFALRGFAETLRMELEVTGPLVTINFPPDTDTPGYATENIGKPMVTKELSATGGLASPTAVASGLLADIAVGRRISTMGVEGAALALATAGLVSPVMEDWLPGPMLGAVIEVLAATPLRVIGIGHATWMRYVVRKHYAAKSEFKQGLGGEDKKDK